MIPSYPMSIWVGVGSNFWHGHLISKLPTTWAKVAWDSSKVLLFRWFFQRCWTRVCWNSIGTRHGLRPGFFAGVFCWQNRGLVEVHPSFCVFSTVPHGFYDVHHIFRLRVLRVLRYDDSIRPETNVKTCGQSVAICFLQVWSPPDVSLEDSNSSNRVTFQPT